MTQKRDACEKLNVNENTFTKRYNLGHSLEECLELIPLISRYTKPFKIDDNLKFIKWINNEYDLCEINNNPVIMSKDQIIRYYHENNLLRGGENYNG